MIEYQEPHNKKHIYIKTIAWVVLVMFTWNQVAYSAGDLFYFKPVSFPATTSPLLRDVAKASLRGSKGDDLSSVATRESNVAKEEAISTKVEELEVTNYDIFSYKKNDSGIGKLLPSMKEQ